MARHGHVTPNPDGMKARCDGPALCRECARELAKTGQPARTALATIHDDVVKTVAVDFDGVIHAYSKGWHDGTIYDGPVDGALDGVRSLMKEYAVVVHTTRDPALVVRWLTGFGFHAEYFPDGGQSPFWNHQGSILVSNRKPAAVAYIDDRGIRFSNWDQALADLAEHEGEARPVTVAGRDAGSLEDAAGHGQQSGDS